LPSQSPIWLYKVVKPVSWFEAALRVGGKGTV
jgi:hypothetical protein